MALAKVARNIEDMKQTFDISKRKMGVAVS